MSHHTYEGADLPQFFADRVIEAALTRYRFLLSSVSLQDMHDQVDGGMIVDDAFGMIVDRYGVELAQDIAAKGWKYVDYWAKGRGMW